MRTLLIAFGLSLFSALALTRLVRDLANHRALSANSGDRKLHTGHLPQLGGIAVAAAFALPLLGLGLVYHNAYSTILLDNRDLITALVVGGLILFVTGLADDFWGLRARHKFVIQIGVGCLVYALGIQLTAINIPIVGLVSLGHMALPATIFWIALVTNAINLIDGLDGLAASVVSLATMTLIFFAVAGGDPLTAVLLVALLGATLGFLAFNISPASIILGDSGSLLLGYSLALISLHSAQKSAALFSLVAATMALAVPLFDLIMAIIRRALSGVPIFSPDQHHIHHQLLRKGMSQRRTMLTLVAAAAVLELLSLSFLVANDWVSAVAVVAVVTLGIFSFRILGYRQVIRHGQLLTVSERMATEAQTKAEQLAASRDGIATATNEDALWAAVVLGIENLGYENVTLTTTPDGPARQWQRTDALNHPHHLDRVKTTVHTINNHGTLTVVRFIENDTFTQHDDLLIASLGDAIALWIATTGQPSTSVP